MRKSFQIYEEMRKYLVIQYIGRPLGIHDFATNPFEILTYEANFLFFFNGVGWPIILNYLFECDVDRINCTTIFIQTHIPFLTQFNILPFQL